MKTKKKKLFVISFTAVIIAALAIVLVLTLFKDTIFPEKIPTDFTVSYDGISTNQIKARTSVHDPSIYQDDGKYYIFGSHMTGAVSEDLRTWKNIANGYKAYNPLFNNLFDKELGIFDYAGDNGNNSYSVWAPDVIYNEALGLYFMYFCTSSTYIKSDICYATSENIDGPYTWQGTLLYSGFTENDIASTDVYQYVDDDYAAGTYLKGNGEYDNQLWPNAIDPSVFYDADGRMWMVYGSWSGGIFILELDPSTGLIIHPETNEAENTDAYFGKRLMGGGHKSIEGPYILYDEESGYYYLFVSYGSLTRTGGYQIRVFRSDKPDGDYVDMNGQYPSKRSNHALFGLKLSGNYYLPSLTKAYMATGHNSAFIDTADGKRYIVYHTRFDDGTETHEPRVRQYILNAEGWPCVLPYATCGETVSPTGYEKSELVGKYYFINQGISIDANIAEPVIIYLTERGNVYGENITGTWTVTGNSYLMTITLDGTTYSGVFCKMKDEADTEVMTFSAVGDNKSICGVKYNTGE